MTTLDAVKRDEKSYLTLSEDAYTQHDEAIKHFNDTGLHLTFDEVEAWLSSNNEQSDIKPLPKFHK